MIQEKCGGLVDLEPAPPEEPEHWRWVKDEENWSRQSKPWIYTTFEPAAETEDTEAEGAEGADDRSHPKDAKTSEDAEDAKARRRERRTSPEGARTSADAEDAEDATTS